MARNPYRDMPRSSLEVPKGSFPITPDDDVDLPYAIRTLTIGTTGGTVAWLNENGEPQSTGFLPVGNWVMAAHRILEVGTTAVGLTGWR